MDMQGLMVAEQLILTAATGVKLKGGGGGGAAERSW